MLPISSLTGAWLLQNRHFTNRPLYRLGQPSGSEHFQFVRHLPHECVFPVVGSDKLCGAEDFQNGMIFAFGQGEKGASKSFSIGRGHTLASYVHVINIGL
jgi:hypothetical protein